MAAWKRISLALALTALAFSSARVATAANQLPLGIILCTLTTVPNVIDADGTAELVGGIRLDCVNYGSRDDGDTNYQQYLYASVSLRFNTLVTSEIHDGSDGTLNTFAKSLLVINGNASLGSEVTSEFPPCDGFTALDPRYPCPHNGRLGDDRLSWSNVRFPVPGAPNDLGNLNPDNAGFQGADPDFDIDFDCDLSAGPLDPTGCFDQVTTLRFTNIRVDNTFIAEFGLVTVVVNISGGSTLGINGSRVGDVAVAVSTNQAPTADAGPNQAVDAVLGTANVTLDGSGSSDPDGDPLAFAWTGPFGAASGVNPQVGLPGGVHTITLTVDDGNGGVDIDRVTIAVRVLEVSPSSLNFLVGDGQSRSQPLSILSRWGLVEYSIPGVAPWLSASPDLGSSSGGVSTVQVIVDPAQPPGTYNADLIILGNDRIMARIPVTMVIPGDGAQPPPLPLLFDHPAVDVADFLPFGEPGHAVAGGSIIAIFGEGFVAGGEFRATALPLPTTLGGVQVLLDGAPAPLFLVTPGLIHAQLPAGLNGPAATLVVTQNLGEIQSNAQEIDIHGYSPAIFTLAQTGEGQAIIVFAGSVDLAAPAGTVGNSRPATAGDFLTIYANGLGPLDPPIEDGHNSCEPGGVCLPDGSNVVLHHTTMTPLIRIGGVEVPLENVLFSGASPASVGVNEIVFQMPPDVPAGDAVAITIEIGEVLSRGDVTMAIQ